MASFFAVAARRATAYSYSSGLLLPPAIAAVTAGATSYAIYKTTSTECESPSATTKDEKKPFFQKPPPAVNFKKRMTSIGRFSLESQTDKNPSIPTCFIALSGSTPLTVSEFCDLWQQRDMPHRHARFHSRVSEQHDGYFEPTDEPVEQHVHETLFPKVYRRDLMHRIQTCLMKPLEVCESLWQMELSSGPLGVSGAISKTKSDQIREAHPTYKESLLLFRFHHVLADGVSLMSAIADLVDEAQQVRDAVLKEIDKRRKKSQSLGFLQRMAKYLQSLIWFCWGSIRALVYQVKLWWVTPACNPFEEVRQLLSSVDNEDAPGRSISWCDAAPVAQIKRVGHSLGGKKVTVNDVIVSCVTYAVSKQLEEHRQRLGEERFREFPTQDAINVAIPVHLEGGILHPDKSIGNNIGAFVARVPGEMEHNSSMESAVERLSQTHDVLYRVKNTPAPLLSHYFAKFCLSCLPRSMTQRIFLKANAGSSVAISNARGSPTKWHLGGRTIESVAGFLPLPPGIPIGVIANSYAGTMSLSVTAEQWAVPDADKFLGWMLEEYQRLLDMAEDQITIRT